jgi:hypothetical protein
MLEEKKVLEIDYLSRKQLKVEYPELIASPSVTQWLKDAKSDSYFRYQMKNPNSVIAKAVKAGKQAHSVLETGNVKSAMDEAVISCFNDDILCDIDKVVGREETLVHPTGYNGKFDLMAQFRGEYTIIDYKKTNKKRTPSTLKSYFQQLMAYRFAHNWLYPSHNVTQVAIVNIYGTDVDELKSNVTVLTPTQMEDYESQFLLRVASGECVGY